MEENQQVIGPWTRVKILGCGGFGQVSLWYKKENEEYIAIKRPQENGSKGCIRDKQMERWCKEVEIMKKMSHLNIVKVLNVPPELESLSKAPMLAMEYCGLGDLRQVLNKPEHCCGLSEPTVIKILKDVSSGLAYLHSCKIIHRDLKPDNIVLQCKESVIVYKLIDLGYAKELDQSSVCKSFVGTIQYLAPELFLGKLYSSSVDYWSFGIVAHEIITGYRPFLPGSNPPEWMKQVQNKSRNIISVIENINGDIVFSSTISRVNHVSRCLLQDIEKWLQLALDWDGEARGRDLGTKKLVFFDVLNEILDKQVVRIFSLPTYEILCYEVKPDTDVFSLKTWLERDTGINADEQILLLRSGKCLDSASIILNCLKKEVLEPGSVSVFLYNCGSIRIRSRVVLKPLYVKELLEDPKKFLTYKHLKRSCSDAVFVLQSEKALFECLLDSVKVKISNIRSRERGVESLFEDVLAEWIQVESFAQFLIISHKSDLENYIKLRKEGALKSCDLVQKWIKNVMCVEKRVADMTITASKKQGKLALEEAREKCKSLENNEFMSENDARNLKDLLNEAYSIWEKIQNISKENRNISRSNTETVKVLYRCIECTTKMLRSPLLDLLFLQLSEAEEHLTKLVSPLTIWSKSCKIMKQIIESTQKERQKEIWGLMLKQKEQENSKIEEKSESSSFSSDEKKEEKEASNMFSPFHIPKTVQSDLKSPVDEIISPNFKIMKPVLVPHKSMGQHLPLGQDYRVGSLESDSLIDTNCYLRNNIEKMSLTCNNLMEEMKSLNWESLT